MPGERKGTGIVRLNLSPGYFNDVSFLIKAHCSHLLYSVALVFVIGSLENCNGSENLAKQKV